MPKNARLRALATALGLAVVVPAAAAGEPAPLALHPANPRYFVFRGRTTVLVASGEHYGSVVNPDFDYVRYLATLEAAGLNATRLFLGDYVEASGAFGIVDDTIAPAAGRVLAPWARSTTPGYALGGARFDLDRWDPAYFERLHGFVREAGRRGIVVEVVLFFVGPGWNESPMNPRNNVNGLPDVGAKGYLRLDSAPLLARQEAYVRKIVSELNPYDDLFFNLCNEPWFYNQERPGFASQAPAATKAWIGRVAEWVVDEEAKRGRRHLLGVDVSNQGSVVEPADLAGPFRELSVFTFHYDGNADSVRLNAGLPRAIGFNETGFNGTGDDAYRTQGWNYLLSGGALYGHLDFSFTVGHEDGTAVPRFSTPTYDGGGSAALRAQLAVLLRFAGSLPLERMRPDDGVVVGGADSWRALAAPGEAYAFWLPGCGPVEVALALPPGEWRFDWVDPLTGEVTSRTARHESWVTKARGYRRGGGAALRVTRAGAPAGR
ncbi:MAG: hypothetical protein U0599_21330 [Vicinamibacteria bacterium]